MPRWKDDDDRGEFGAWLSAQVGDRTFDWLAAEMVSRGHPHGAAYYRAMASGAKPPGRAIRRALREYFGASPDEPKQPPADPVAAAIDRQTVALTKAISDLTRTLVLSLRSDVRRPGWGSALRGLLPDELDEGLERGMEAEQSHLEALGSEAPQERSAPRARAG